MGDVVHLNCITTLPVSPDLVIERTAEYGLKEVVIIGFTDDMEPYFASSLSDSGDILYWLEKAKWMLMKMDEKIRAEGDPRGRDGA